MPYIIKEDELMHYGRKGMKWGKNIFSSNDSSTSRARTQQERRASKSSSSRGKKAFEATSAISGGAYVEKEVDDALHVISEEYLEELHRNKRMTYQVRDGRKAHAEALLRKFARVPVSSISKKNYG